MKENPFSTLGISAKMAKSLDYNDPFLKNIYRHYAKKSHSDLGGRESSFIRLNTAYTLLTRSEENFEKYKKRLIKRNVNKNSNIIPNKCNDIGLYNFFSLNLLYNNFENYKKNEGKIFEYYPKTKNSFTPQNNLKTIKIGSGNKLFLVNRFSQYDLKLKDKEIEIPNTYFIGTIKKEELTASFKKNNSQVNTLESLIAKSNREKNILNNNIDDFNNIKPKLSSFEFQIDALRDYFDIVRPEIQENSFLLSIKKKENYNTPLFLYMGTITNILDE